MPSFSEYPLSDTARIEGDQVIRTGKFFECGTEFTDMNGVTFSVSEEEADRLLPAFTGGRLNIEHMPTVLDGLLGSVRRLWRDGKDIVAEYAIPKDLHSLTAGRPIKTSSEWDLASKRPLGAALVLNPAVQDAVMMAAFSQAGPAAFARSVMQEFHDRACDAGAECPGKALLAADGQTARAALAGSPGTAQFITPELLKAVQHLHDHAAKNGASCDQYATRQSMYGFSQPVPAGTPPAPSGTSPRKGNSPMPIKFKDFLARWQKAGMPDEIDLADDDSAPPALRTDVHMSAADQARFAQMEAAIASQSGTIAELTAQLAQQQGTAAFKEAESRIAGWVRAMKITPAEAEVWKTLAQDNPAAFSAAVPALEARSPLPQLRGYDTRGYEASGENARRQIEGSSPDADKLVQMTAARQKEDQCDYVTAFRAVCAENPTLAAEYRAAQGRIARQNAEGEGN